MGNNESRKGSNGNKMPQEVCRKRTSSYAVIAVLLMFLFVACGTTVYHSDFKEFGVSGWAKEEPLKFVLPDSLDAVVGELVLNVRHDNYYPYRNLWVVVDYVFDEKVVDSDTVNVELADKFGNWHGAGLGKLFQHSLVVRRNFPIDKYDSVIIWQNMRCDTVPHVSDIGIALVPVEL